jgi:hypothetical protein
MNTLEELTREHAVRGSSDHAFGIVFSAFLRFAGLFLAVTILRPAWAHPLNQGWMKLGLFLGRIVNPIVMGLLFFLIVAPTAVIFRLLGKDPLRLSLDAGVPRYWIERCPPDWRREPCRITSNSACEQMSSFV